MREEGTVGKRADRRPSAMRQQNRSINAPKLEDEGEAGLAKTLQTGEASPDVTRARINVGGRGGRTEGLKSQEQERPRVWQALSTSTFEQGNLRGVDLKVCSVWGTRWCQTEKVTTTTKETVFDGWRSRVASRRRKESPPQRTAHVIIIIAVRPLAPVKRRRQQPSMTGLTAG